MLRFIVVAAGLVTTMSGAFGQAVTYERAIGNPAEDSTAVVWEKIESGLTAGEVANLAAERGWPSWGIQALLGDEGRYDLHRRPIGPGSIALLIVPTSGDAPVVELHPQYTTLKATSAPAFFVSGETLTEALRETIVTIVEAACDMPFRPSSISVSASVGVASAELGWTPDTACAETRPSITPPDR